jgi:hypothetical protein
VAVGQFQEADFRDKIFAGELTSDQYYWYEGMEDWKPIADYRALARTQRITFDPEPVLSAEEINVQTAKRESGLARLLGQIKSKLGRS